MGSSFLSIISDSHLLIETTSKPPTYFMVSRDRVENFIGRESQLNEISSHFSNDRAAQPRILILHALGGQGKSQIALEYCRRSRGIYRGIFWISAGSKTTAMQSYRNIANLLLGVSPSEDSDDAEVVIRLVKAQLENWNERWLLIFDNYDQPELFGSVKRLIPAGR
jgi:hypothetical protein